MKTELGKKILEKIETDKNFFAMREQKMQETFNELFEAYLLENTGKFVGKEFTIDQPNHELRHIYPRKDQGQKFNFKTMIENFCKHHGFGLKFAAKEFNDPFNDRIYITIPKDPKNDSE